MAENNVPLEPELYFHIYNHAVGKENLFERDSDYLYFLDKMRKHLLPVSEVISYCLMPNHFHLVVRMKKAEEIKNHLKQTVRPEDFEKINDDKDYVTEYISRAYSNFFNTYAKHYNFWKGRTGTLFKRTFRRNRIGDMEYLRRLVCYVHQNPVEAGFVNKPEEWKYSSYNALLGSGFTLIPRDEIIGLFGDLENLKFCHSKVVELDLE